jgi:uncharacterized protein
VLTKALVGDFALQSFVRKSIFPVPARALWQFHAQPGALQRLLPPWQDIGIVSWTGTLKDAQVKFKVPAGPIRITWHAQHDAHEFVDGQRFADIQQSGPMASWRHVHTILPVMPSVGVARGPDEKRSEGQDRSTRSSMLGERSELTDDIAYSLPLGFIAEPLAGWKVRGDLETMFGFRHLRTMLDCARHNVFADKRKLRIVVAGASGTIGSALCAYLINGGHTVDRLVRREPQATGDGTAFLCGKEIQWDPTSQSPNGQLVEALDGADAVINLCGASIADGKWTEGRKAELTRSRHDPTITLAKAIGKCKMPPKVFVSASGSNIYDSSLAGETDGLRAGASGSTERSALANTWIANLAKQWENAALLAIGSTRVVLLRLGVVLSAKGGFLREMADRPAPLGMGFSRLGDGEQILPWVDIDDALAAIEHVLHTEELIGPVNVAAPCASSNRQVLGAIARSTRRLSMPAPARIIRLIAGAELAETILQSQHVAPLALEASGFRFAFTDPQASVGKELGDRRVIESLAIPMLHFAEKLAQKT